MDGFKFATLFVVLGSTLSIIVPVQSYGVYQPQYFYSQQMQQPYSPYPYYDIYRLNHGAKNIPSPGYQPAYPSKPQPRIPTVYNYFGTPVYDFRYPVLPFYPGGRPIFPSPPGPYGPYDPFSPENPEKDSDDNIEKLNEHEVDKNKDMKPKNPKDGEDTTEPTEGTTELIDDTVTVDALPE